MPTRTDFTLLMIARVTLLSIVSDYRNEGCVPAENELRDVRWERSALEFEASKIEASNDLALHGALFSPETR